MTLSEIIMSNTTILHQHLINSLDVFQMEHNDNTLIPFTKTLRNNFVGWAISGGSSIDWRKVIKPNQGHLMAPTAPYLTTRVSHGLACRQRFVLWPFWFCLFCLHVDQWEQALCTQPTAYIWFLWLTDEKQPLISLNSLGS